MNLALMFWPALLTLSATLLKSITTIMVLGTVSTALNVPLVVPSFFSSKDILIDPMAVLGIPLGFFLAAGSPLSSYAAWSPVDCRLVPNNYVVIQGSKHFTIPRFMSRVSTPVYSRDIVFVDCRYSSDIPQNSRSAPPF